MYIGPLLFLISILVLSNTSSSSKPQALTLGELASRGPRGNNHIELTGFVPSGGVIYYYQETSGQRISRWATGKRPEVAFWESAYVPLYDGPDRRRIRALVLAAGVHNEADLDRWRRSRGKIHGMITGTIKAREEKTDLLLELYPDADLSKCYLITEGATPVRRGLWVVFLLLGLFLFLFGVVGILLRPSSPGRRGR